MKKQMRKGIFDGLFAAVILWGAGKLGETSYSLLGSSFIYWFIVMAGTGFVAGSYVRIGVKAARDADFLLVARAMVFVPSFYIWIKFLTGVLHLDFSKSNVQYSAAGVFIGYFVTLFVLAVSPMLFEKKQLKSIARLSKLISR